MSITDFLLARVAEDEQRVDTIPDWFCTTDSARGEGWGSRGSECDLCGRYMFDGSESATKEAWWDHMEAAHGRIRVLAECTAKRAIIELHQNWPVLVEEAPTFSPIRTDRDTVTMSVSQRMNWMTQREYIAEFGTEPPTAPMLAAMAAVYADHPDYREEWAT